MAKTALFFLLVGLIGYGMSATTTSTLGTTTTTTPSYPIQAIGAVTQAPGNPTQTTTMNPLARFKDVFDDLRRVCTLKYRNYDCYDEEDALTLRVNRGFDVACEYRPVYTVCLAVRCDYSIRLTDAIRDLDDVCDYYGATTTTIDGTPTTAAPVAPKDQLAKIIVGIDCKYACDTEKRAVYDEIMKTGNNKVACSKLRPYTDCLRSECATPVADTIMSSMKDLCYEDASPPARGLSGLMLKLSANLYLQ